MSVRLRELKAEVPASPPPEQECNETIHVELASPCEASEFIEFLATRGLTGSITTRDDHCDIEVRYAVDPEVRLRHDFEAALSSWLEKGGRPLIPAFTASTNTCSGRRATDPAPRSASVWSVAAA